MTADRAVTTIALLVDEHAPPVVDGVGIAEGRWSPDERARRPTPGTAAKLQG